MVASRITDTDLFGHVHQPRSWPQRLPCSLYLHCGISRRSLAGRDWGAGRFAERILEPGVGTGNTLPYYPPGTGVTAIDVSPRMLEVARQLASRRSISVTLEVADAQAPPYPDESFDSGVTAFVFCPVPDPVVGSREVYRVLKPGGPLRMLEHVLSTNRVLRPLMHGANPLVVRIMGANINRQTVRNVEGADFELDRVDDLMFDIVKVIEAHKPE